jgi:hypothetical protein
MTCTTSTLAHSNGGKFAADTLDDTGRRRCCIPRTHELGRGAEWSAEATKMHALAAIAQWGQDPVPLANIELFTRAATQQRPWAPQPMA